MRISGLAAIALTLFSLSILIIGIYSTLTIAQRTGFDINIGLTILGVVIPSLVAIGTTLISLYKSEPKIKVRIHSQRAEGAGGTNTGSKIIFNSWRIPYTIISEGETIGRIFESKISASVTPEMNNIVGDTHGFGPGNQSDFFVYPSNPLTGHTDIRIRPKIRPSPSWDAEFQQSVNAGLVSVTITIEYKVGDQAKDQHKGVKKFVLDAELMRVLQ